MPHSGFAARWAVWGRGDGLGCGPGIAGGGALGQGIQGFLDVSIPLFPIANFRAGAAWGPLPQGGHKAAIDSSYNDARTAVIIGVLSAHCVLFHRDASPKFRNSHPKYRCVGTVSQDCPSARQVRADHLLPDGQADTAKSCPSWLH
jgi:hypothetical protein